MISRISTVARGRMIDFIDGALKAPNEAMLQAHEAQASSQLSELGVRLATLPSNPDAVRHMNDEFLGDGEHGFFPPGGSIPDFAGKSAILHSAYVQALRVALYQNPDDEPDKRVKREQALPIVSYWIMAGKTFEHFEIYVSLSSQAQEVHVFLVTPDPQNVPRPPAEAPRSESIWAIATADRIKMLRDAIPGDYVPPPPFALKGDAQCQKVVSY